MSDLDVRERYRREAAVRARQATMGTSPDRVREALAEARARFDGGAAK